MAIPLLITIVLIGALAMTWRRASQQAIRHYEAALWSLVWIGSATIVWIPDATTTVAHRLGIGRGVDLILYAAVIVLLLFVFQLHLAHERLERSLTELIRRQALSDVATKTDKSTSL